MANGVEYTMFHGKMKVLGEVLYWNPYGWSDGVNAVLWCEGLWCESVCMRLWVRGIAGGQPGVRLRSGEVLWLEREMKAAWGVEADEGEADVG